MDDDRVHPHLTDDELFARLLQRGVARELAQDLVRWRFSGEANTTTALDELIG